MVTLFAGLLVVHGLIHVLGAAKAFHWAELPQLTRPIPPALGVAWMVAASLFVASAICLFTWPRWWWVIGLCGVVVSMFLVIPAWQDAKFGAVANVVVLVGVFFGFLSQGPYSLRAQYERDIESRLSATPETAVAEADLAGLPEPVQRYLRKVGVVGQPRVRSYRVTMQGRIRGGARSRWMPFSAEQHNFVDPAARLFYLNASMFGIPVQGYHRYVDRSASMLVKAAALVPVADERGPEMTKSETVTLFNDMCLMAPATLIDRTIEWEPVDARTVRARFTNAGQTIRAELTFDDDGLLTNFASGDRSQSSAAGPRLLRWSTPVSHYRQFGPMHLMGGGEGRWLEAEGEYAYIEMTIDTIRYNVD